MDTDGFARAVEWKVKLQQARQGLDEDRTILEGPTLQVMTELVQLFSKRLCPPTLSLTRARLRTAHKEYAEVLRMQASLRRIAATKALAQPPLPLDIDRYNQLSQEIRELNERLEYRYPGESHVD